MPISKSLRFEILARDGFRCGYCGAASSETNLHVDHVIPFAQGGTDEPDNLKAACADCNLGKSDRLLIKQNTGFDLSPDKRVQRMKAAQFARAAQGRHWIDSGILDVLDHADGLKRVAVYCQTHQRMEEHWISEHRADVIERNGADPGWL